MVAISPASRTFTILILLVPAILTVPLLRNPSGGDDGSTDTSSLTINFSTDASFTARQTEMKITAVIEDWLTQIPGIREIYSETRVRNGFITVYPETGAAPEVILAGIVRLLRLRQNQLPEDIRIKYNFSDPQIRMADILLAGKYLESAAEVEKLQEYLTTFDGVRQIRMEKKEQSRLFYVHENYRAFLDSATLNHIPRQVIPFSEGMIPVHELKATAWNDQRAHIPLSAALIPDSTVNAAYSRYNGRKVIRMTAVLDKTDPRELFLYLRNWIHFDNDIILPDHAPASAGFRVTWIRRSGLLLLFLAILSMFMQSKRQLERILGGIILFGSTICIPRLFGIQLSGTTEQLSEISLAASLVILYGLRIPRSIFIGNSISTLVFMAGAVWLLDDKWVLLITPFLASLMAYAWNPGTKAYDISVRPYHLLLIIIPICLSQVFPWKIWSFESEGIWNKMDQLPEPRLPGNSNGRSTVKAHLFLQDRDPLFSSSYIFSLEKDLIPLLQDDDHLFIEVKQGNEATISVHLADDPKSVYSLLNRKALMCSGVHWYISVGELSFSNTASPLMPSIQWVLSGHNLDTLMSYTNTVADVLRSTARVRQVSTERESWVPSGKNTYDMESWHSFVLPRNSLWPADLHGGKNVTVISRPASRWRLYNERYYQFGRYYRGHQLLDSLEHENGKVIRKKDRAYLAYIGHEFSGGKKLTDKFIHSARERIQSVLPEGISLLNHKKDGGTRHQDKKRTLIFSIFTVLGLSLIRAGSRQRLYWVFTAISAISFSLCIILNLYIHLWAEIIAEWADHLLILAICLLFAWRGRFHPVFLFLGLGFTILMGATGRDWNLTGGMSTLLVGMTIAHLASRWSSGALLPLRISHGHRFFQKH